MVYSPPPPPFSSATQPLAMDLMKFVLFSLLSSFLFINHTVKCDSDEDDNLYQSINKYRASLNLTTLTKNDNAGCLADKIADQFKNQPCTNTTGANTVPGTEPQFSNYPDLLAECHLNVSDTRDGAVMPACVPNLDPNLVFTNFTQSLYSSNLNDTKFTGIGVGSEGNWIVAVLTTNNPEGSFSPDSVDSGANIISKIGSMYWLVLSLVGSLFLL